MIYSAQVIDDQAARQALKAQSDIEPLRKLALTRLSELDGGRVQTLDFVVQMRRIRDALQNK